MSQLGAYPLGSVARRLHNPAMCSCCGLPGLLLTVNVRAIEDGRRSTIILCERCVSSDDRAWRLRWQPVPYAR